MNCSLEWKVQGLSVPILLTQPHGRWPPGALQLGNVSEAPTAVCQSPEAASWDRGGDEGIGSVRTTAEAWGELPKLVDSGVGSPWPLGIPHLHVKWGTTVVCLPGVPEETK